MHCLFRIPFKSAIDAPSHFMARSWQESAKMFGALGGPQLRQGVPKPGEIVDYGGTLNARCSQSLRSDWHRVPNIISGKEVWPEGESIDLVNPATGQIIGEVAASSAACVDSAVAIAKAAIQAGCEWQQTSLEQRCAAVSRLGSLLEASSDKFAQAESRDTGKPLALTRAVDIPRSVANLKFFAELAPHAGNDMRYMKGPLESMSYSIRKPVGVVGIISPWNLPLYLFTWKVAPALVMGNSVVAKPSEVTPTTATMLAELALEAGIPAGVLNVIHGHGIDAGQSLASHPDVSAISFTGGTVTGTHVAAAAAPMFKKLSLELGGKNAAVVFEDCSFDDTVDGIVRSAFLNSGQICLCSSRVLVQKGADGSFYKRFVQALVKAAKNLVIGLPNEPTTSLGPLISSAHRAKVSNAVEVACREGGTILCGGGAPDHIDGEGFFFEPTIIDNLSVSSLTAQTEIFGPVITVHAFDTAVDAVEMANATKYGLSASVWTESLSNAEIVENLHAGTVWLNTWLNRELHMPFGGVRDSGVNREGGVHSLDFYSETSTICVKRGSRKSLPMPGSMQKRSFSTYSPPDAPKPLGDYVHATRAGDLVFLAGIGPRDPETNEVPGGPVEDATGAVRDYDATAQARQCFANVQRILQATGCSKKDILDVQVFLTDLKRDFTAFNAVWADEMAGVSATRTTIGISDLPPGGRIAVEMKVIALHPDASK